jgi:hypothetical protein
VLGPSFVSPADRRPARRDGETDAGRPISAMWQI